MHRVRLSKTIWTHGPDDAPKGDRALALFVKETSLPFPPFPTLRLFIDSSDTGAIKSVTWLADESVFLCAVEDEYPEWLDDANIEYEDLIPWAHEQGWKRVGGNAPSAVPSG